MPRDTDGGGRVVPPPIGPGLPIPGNLDSDPDPTRPDDVNCKLLEDGTFSGLRVVVAAVSLFQGFRLLW